MLLKSCQFFNRHLPNVRWSAKKKLWKSAIFHSFKPPFDAEVAEKFLNGIYYVCVQTNPVLNGRQIRKKDFEIWIDYFVIALTRWGKLTFKVDYSLETVIFVINRLTTIETSREWWNSIKYEFGTPMYVLSKFIRSTIPTISTVERKSI